MELTSTFYTDFLGLSGIYQMAFYLQGVLAGLAVGFLFLGAMLRWLMEAVRNFGGDANAREALADQFKAASSVLIYMVLGLSLFGVAAAWRDFAGTFGSIDLIAEDLAALVEQAELAHEQAQQESQQSVFSFGTVLSALSWGGAGASWVWFQFTSALLTFTLAITNLAWAMAAIVAYAWGYIALTTVTLRASLLDITGGWARTWLWLIYWPVVEALMLLVMRLYISDKAEMISDAYGQAGATDITGGGITTSIYAATGTVCAIITFVLLLAPTITAFLAANQNAGKAMAAPFTGMVGAFAGAAGAKAASTGSQMAPSSGGSRFRDRLTDNPAKAVPEGAKSAAQRTQAAASKARAGVDAARQVASRIGGKRGRGLGDAETEGNT